MPQVAAEKVVEGEESSPQSLKREPNPNDLPSGPTEGGPFPKPG